MRVYLGSDHAGYELKVHLASHLGSQGYDVVDVGPPAFDPEDDYPAYCLHTGARVVADPGSLGVVIGGSGNGEQIAANRAPGVGAPRAWTPEPPQLPRKHNDATVAPTGARIPPPDEPPEIAPPSLPPAFPQGDRHKRRITQVA